MTIPKDTQVWYDYKRRSTGSLVTHTVHRFRCSYRGTAFEHITVCEHFKAPDWLI